MHERARRPARAMTGQFSSPVFIWLLMTASVGLTSGQTGDPNTTTMVPLNSTGNTTGTQTTNSEVFSTSTQTANTPTDETSSPINTSVRTTTGDMTSVGPSTAVTGTAQTSSSTTPTAGTQTPSDSTQSQDTGTTSTPGFGPSDGSTRPASSTELGSTAPASTTAGEDTYESTTRVTGGGSSAAPPTTSYRTSTRVPRTTKATNRPGRPGGGAKPSTGTNPGKAVAGVIGGALILMMVAFLVIYYKKRKLQQQKNITTDWAGPSPFLDGEANGQVLRQASNRVSLSSFLPQRMSKRLSLLPETEEELQDMTPATFGSKHLESSKDLKANGNGTLGKNGSAAVGPEPKPAADSKEVRENSAASPQTGHSPTTKDNSDASTVDENSSAKPSDAAEAVDKSHGADGQ